MADDDDKGTGGTGGTGTGTGGTGGTGGSGTPPVVGADGERPDQLVQMTKERYSQEIAKIANREKDQGRRSAIAELAQKLGVSDPSEIEQIVTAYRQQEDAKLSDADRAKVEAERLLAQAQKRDEEAAKKLLEAKSTAALSKAGAIDPDLLVTALEKMGITADSDDAAIDDAIKQLKEQRPSQFAAPGVTGGGAGDAGRPPAGSPHAGESGKVKTAQERAKENVERIQMRRNGGRKPAAR